MTKQKINKEESYTIDSIGAHRIELNKTSQLLELTFSYETIISSWNRLLSGILQFVSRHIVVESDQFSIDNNRNVARTHRNGEIFC